jgi:ABC-2 type transport system ATP-binding protein
MIEPGPLIEALGLTKRFGQAVAVDDVSFSVSPGEVVGLLGANGAGKTTVMRMLLGLLAPTSGRARLLGGAPSQDNRAGLGYLPQGLGLYQELTAAENVAFTAAAYKSEPATLVAPLADVAHRLVRDLPSGLQRQLAFVCAVQHSPRALMLDEPTSGMEPLARAHLWDKVQEQADRGVGVLVSTHYMQEARQCDRLLLMSRGALVGSGSEAQIVGDTKVVQVESESWQAVFDALNAADLPVTLAGRAVRVVGVEVAEVERLLSGSGLVAAVRPVPASIDERMVVLARS